MKSLITIALLALPLSSLADPAHEAATGPDILRFANHDTLHGSFLSFGKNHTILWKNAETTAPIPFSTQKVHRIILNRGKGHQSVDPHSTVTLINGDIIPGRITSIDKQSLTLETNHLGTLSLPIDTVSQIAPTPFGGKILYYGPLNTDGWKTALPPEPKKKDNEKKETAQKKEEDKEKKLTDWKHIASAWYTGTDKARYLVRENALPDKCRLSFKLAWRNSLSCNIALHADFAPPEYEDAASVRNNMASTVGKAYILNFSAHSAYLYSCTFLEDGKPSSTRIGEAQVSLKLSGKEDAQFELRIDRPNKQLLLYLNGNFKAKWDLGEDYAGKGNSLAFRNLGYNNAQLRVSEILITQWNGLRDSAQSMKNQDRDIILLTNGIDRFSGTFNHLTNGKISFKSTYNNTFTIPTTEIQEIHFASNKLRKLPENPEEKIKPAYFYIQPYGRISGIPSMGGNGKTTLTSTLLGELTLDTRYVNIIDFSHQNSLLDLWDDNF